MNKKIIVVGGTSGLGRRLAELYAAQGSMVGVIGRREELLTELKNAYPKNITVQKADVTNEDIGENLRKLIAGMGNVDTIIITASVAHLNDEFHFQPEIDTISLNVNGFGQVLQTAWDYFKTRGSGQIVGVTSIAAIRGNKRAPAYHASKAFQSIYLESLRVKAKHEKNGIIVTELIPGYIDTQMGKGNRLFWVASLKKAGRQSKRAIDNKRKRVFITKRWWFVYTFLKWIPGSIYVPLVNGSWKLKQKN
ncbi:MAG TPA: SDR family NAD(P)-dependent oxidoreductase [Chitinophagaceae bacterium]|nr:SDR family NAD(P)-dependent oxidoreductase [Chitinophagaceae bacterium]